MNISLENCHCFTVQCSIVIWVVLTPATGGRERDRYAEIVRRNNWGPAGCCCGRIDDNANRRDWWTIRCDRQSEIGRAERFQFLDVDWRYVNEFAIAEGPPSPSGRGQGEGLKIW